MHATYADVLTVVAEVRPMLASGDDVLLVLGAPGPVNASLLDALARLALYARQAERTLRVTADGPQLRELAELVGLDELIGLVETAR